MLREDQFERGRAELHVAAPLRVSVKEVGETEAGLMEKLSPTLRSKLCVHIFGRLWLA